MADEQGFKAGSAYITVDPDTEGFAEKLRAAIEEAVDGIDAKVKIGADDSELQAKADDARAKVDELDGTEAKATITADDEDLAAKTDKSKADLDEIDSTEAKATLTADDEDLSEKTDDAKEKLGQLDASEASPKLDLDKDEFDAKKDDADARLEANDATRVSPKLGLDDDEFKAKLAEDEASLSAAGESGGGGEGGIPGGLMTYLAGGLTSILPGIAGASTGLGELAGTGYLAFDGIAKALSAHKEASQNVGETSAQLASTEEQDSVQIQQAQQAIGQAHRQAAEDAITSAEAISSAEANLTEVERNAAASQVQAVQAVGQAQQQLQQSNFGLAQAQYNLSMAWITARLNLEQLNDAERDSATTIAAAKLAVQQAQYQQTLTDQNAYSTNLDKEQAAIAVAQAEEALTGAQQQATATAAEAHLEDRKGVAGSQAVVSAQEAVTEAVDAQKNAQQQLQDAQMNLRNTELNNAAQIKAAQLAVSQAQQQAAYQQESDALAVQQAQQNLTNTLKEQKLQQEATASTQNQAANQFAKDMARLSPAGREMVTMILSISKAFTGMEAIAQRAVAPGMVQFLKGIKDLLPDITFGVRLMGQSISTAFGQFGKEMQTKAFSDVFRSLLVQGNQFIDTVLPAFAQFIQELARVGGEKGAVTGLADILAGIGNGLTAVVRALGPFVGSLSSVLGTLGSALRPIGTLLGDVVGGIARALAPGLKALLPGFTKFVDLLGSSLAKALSSLGPDLGIVGGALGSILSALSPLLPVLGQFIGAAAQALAPALSAVAGALTPLASTLAQALKPVIIALTPILGSMGGMLGHIAVSLADVLVALLPLLPPLANLLVGVIDLLAPLIKLGDFLGGLMLDALDGVVKGVGWVIKAIAGWLTQVTDWQKSWQEFSSQLGTIWHQMTSAWDATGQAIQQIAGDLWSYLWGDFGAKIENFFTQTIPGWWDSFWGSTKSIFNAGVSALGTIWNGLESVFTKPVDFLVNVVYDKGIAWLWNEVVTHIPGLSGIKLPTPHIGLARGGIVPGSDHGRDEVLMPMRPEEGVLTPPAVRGLGGPPAIYALNNHFDPASNRPKGIGHGHLTGMGGGGVVSDILGGAGSAVGSIGSALGNIGGPITGILGSLLGGAGGGASAATIAAAFVNAANKFVRTPAKGDLGKMMTGIPHQIIDHLRNALLTYAASAGGGGTGKLPTGGSGAVGDLPANWHTIASFLASHGFTKFAAAGVSGNIEAESGGQPEILEAGGGGGGGLIQWTPYPPGYITGNYQADLMTQLNAILSWGGGPSIVNRATSPSNAAEIYQDLYERPASLTASLPVRMASANAVYKAMGWGTFDQGGMLTGPPNFTGQPEQVLDPQQTQDFTRLVNWLTTTRGGDGGSAGPTVTQIFNGPQMPSAEQLAEMRRDLGMALSGP